MPVWTIEINGVSKKYKTLELHRKLILNTPTSFSATIEYSSNIHFMDVVEIKRDGTTEWKGYIEKLNPFWDAEGEFFNISGRDVTLILWKKYNDDFTNFAQKTAGMFGTVDPMQLLHFVLHTPKSEIGVDYPYNKEGWGLDFSRTIDTERVISHDIDDNNFMLGNPQWVFSRERGYGWSNTGRETYESVYDVVDSATLGPWVHHGGASSPYINGNTMYNQTDYNNNHIMFRKSQPNYTPLPSAQILHLGTSAFSLSGKSINAVLVNIGYRFNKNSTVALEYASTDGISLSVYSKTKNQNVLVVPLIHPDLTGLFNTTTGWITSAFDITSYISNQLDLEDINLEVIISTAGTWLNVWNDHDAVEIGYVSLTVLEGTANSLQSINDDFEIAFKPQLLIPTGSNYSAINTPLSIDRNGIVGEYLLNEGTGTTIHDSSGTNANALAYNPHWVQGPNSYILRMDGAGHYVDCGSGFTWLTGHNEMTIDCWVSFTTLLNPDSPLYRNVIAVKATQFWLYVAGVNEPADGILAGELVWRLYTGSGWHILTAPAGVIIQNGRDHIQCLYDGYSMNIYVNNELVATDLEDGYIINDTGDNKLYIGSMYGFISDLLIYNRATYPNITALYIECRANPTYYPRAYTVEHLDEYGDWSVIPNTSPTMPQVYNSVSNPYPSDIIISFPPISTQKIRMRLTGNYAGTPWSISQIYVYKSEDIKYRPYLDSTESDPSTSPLTDPYVYTGGPYIHAFSNQLSAIANPIGPLNMSRQRMLDVVNYLIGLSSDTSIGENEVVGFLPFEWWLSYDANNTFNIKNQKGSNKTGIIIFQDAVNLGSCNYNQFIDDTVQNVYVVGQGEQKKLQDTSLWVKSARATGNATNGQPLANSEKTVRTFYEDAIQDKTIVIDDYKYPAIGNMVGSSNLTINAMPRIQLIITLSNDTFNSMDYDVGDVIKVIDSLTGIGSTDPSLGEYRIQNIDKIIQVDTGEQVTITLGYPNYKFEDELQTMYRNMKSFGIVGTFNDDWSAEGTDKKLLDARLISTSSQYSQDAQNDKMAQSIPYNSTLWKTSLQYFANPPETKVLTDGVDTHFMWGSNDWFGASSTTGGSHAYLLKAILLGNVVNYYDPTTSTLKNGCDAANINMTWNPHMVMDIKCCDGVYSDIVGATWVYGHWNRGSGHLVKSELTSTSPYSGDYCRVGMADDYGNGFWFMFVKVSNDAVTTPALFDVFVQWKLIDGTTNFDTATFNYENLPVGSGMDSPNGSYIKTIIANQRYKIEMVTQSDPNFIATNTPNLKFNLYEYKNVLSTTNDGLQLNYIQLTYPTLGIIVNSAIQSMILKPLECEFYNLAQSAPASGQFSSAINLYKWTTDWTIKQVEIGKI